jgi:ribosomal protein S1
MAKLTRSQIAQGLDTIPMSQLLQGATGTQPNLTNKQIEFAKLEVGQVHQGKVSGITEYGMFVEIGMLAGLVHKTKMGESTPELFTMHQEIEVEIIDIDFDKSRFSLQYRG